MMFYLGLEDAYRGYSNPWSCDPQVGSTNKLKSNKHC
jgi:hypothetical protein